MPHFPPFHISPVGRAGLLRLNLALVLIVLLSFLLPLIQVKAQSPTNTPTPTPTPGPDWTHTFNFAASDGAWAANSAGLATYTGGTGWTNSGTDGGCQDTDWILFTFLRNSTITHAEASMTTTTVHVSYQAAAISIVSGFTFVSDSTIAESPGGTLTYNGSHSVSSGSQITIQSVLGTHCDGHGTSDGVAVWYHAYFEGTGVDPFLSVDPTATPTATPTPIATPGGGFSAGAACTILGINDSTFLSGSAWTLTPPATLPGTGLNLPSGSAALTTNLDAQGKYIIELHFHTTNTFSTDQEFSVQLGSSPALTVPNVAGGAPQTYQSLAANYAPDGSVGGGFTGSHIYTLLISKAVTSPDPGLIVDFACLSVQEANTSGVGETSSVTQVQCQNCTYRPVGDLIQDLPKLFDWIFCFLSNLWTCVIRQILLGIWTSIVNVIAFIAFFRTWIGLTISAAINWINGNITVIRAWFGGFLANIITSMLNAGLNILRQLGLLTFLTNVVQLIASLPAAIADIIASVGNFITTVVNTISNIWALISDWITRALNLVFAVLGVVPQLIASVVAGFNSTSSLPNYAPACSNPSSLLYYPCLGMYVLDNTVFDGPAYYLILLAMGVVAFNTIMWVVKVIQENIGKT